MNPTLCRCLLITVSVVLGIAAAAGWSGAGSVRAVLGTAAGVLLAAALLVRTARGAPAVPVVPVTAVEATTDAVMRRVLGADREHPSGPTSSVQLTTGHGLDGAPVALPAADGIAVVGSGALAAALYRALLDQLLDAAAPRDELRCLGMLPSARSGAAEGRPDDSATSRTADDRVGRDDDGDSIAQVRRSGSVDATGADALPDRGVAAAAAGTVVAVADADADAVADAEVDVATLVAADGAVRGAVVRSRESGRPRAPGAVITVGPWGCRLTRPGRTPEPLDPVLPRSAPHATGPASPETGSSRCSAPTNDLVPPSDPVRAGSRAQPIGGV